MKVKRKPEIFEATQWWRNGDHPRDNVFRMFEDTRSIPTQPREGAVVRYFRNPGIDGESKCLCGYRFHDHGFIDIPMHDIKVCPGDYIVENEDGDLVEVVAETEFMKKYMASPV